jgi:hypothetical protein
MLKAGSAADICYAGLNPPPVRGTSCSPAFSIRYGCLRIQPMLNFRLLAAQLEAGGSYVGIPKINHPRVF